MKNVLLWATAFLLLLGANSALRSQGAGTLVNIFQFRPITNAPTITVTTVTTTTPNSFPIPSGKTTCIVTRNIAQSPGVDYNVTAGAVVFIATPQVGDTVQLNCW